MKKNNETIYLFIIVGLGILVMALSYTLYKYDLQISERNSLIEEMRAENSDRSEKIDTLVQSVIKTSTITKNGQPITTDELIKYTNYLAFKVTNLEDSLSYYKSYYKLSQQTYKNEFRISKNDADKIVYEFLGKVPDSTQFANIRKELEILIIENHKLNEAIKKYGITMKDTEDKKGYLISAPTVDSALALFPYYRDKIKISNDGKRWIITTPE